MENLEKNPSIKGLFVVVKQTCIYFFLKEKGWKFCCSVPDKWDFLICLFISLLDQ